MTNGESNEFTRESRPGSTTETTPSGTQAEYQRSTYREGNGGSSSPEINAEIERTRRQMGRRIDQIQDRLDPDRLIDEAQTAVRDVLSDTASSITDYVRENRDTITKSVTRAAGRNPLPTALIGLGLGWLLLESMSGDSKSSSRRSRKWDRERQYQDSYINRRQVAYGEIYSDPMSDAFDDTDELDYDYDTSGMGGYDTGAYGSSAVGRSYSERRKSDGSSSGPIAKVKDAASNVAETVKGQVEDVVENVQQKAEELGHRAEDQLSSRLSSTGDRAREMGGRAQHEMGDRAREMGGRAQEMTHEMGGRMRRMTRRRKYQLQNTLEDNPLTYGIVALAAGAVIAYILPQTRMENEAMGELRDRMVDEADDMMHEAADRAKQVVDEVRPELERSAKQVGQELEQSAKQVGQELAQTAKQAGQRAKEEINPVVEKAKEAAKDEARKAASERGKSQTTSGQSATSQSATTSGQSATSQSATSQSTSGQTQVTSTADRNKMQGQWRELRGTVKQKWGKLTDDDLTQIEGKYEKLTGALQRHYGYSQTQAEREIDEFLRNR